MVRVIIEIKFDEPEDLDVVDKISLVFNNLDIGALENEAKLELNDELKKVHLKKEYDLHDVKIDELNHVNARMINALARAGIFTLYDLVNYSSYLPKGFGKDCCDRLSRGIMEWLDIHPNDDLANWVRKLRMERY